MTSELENKATPATSKTTAPSTQSEHRKRRLAEQLRQNLKNRKAQARERRNFDKHIDE